jgi:hypothetical protein
MAYILLLDIAKQRVRLDAVDYPVGGGFRGFQNVLPGYHQVGVAGTPSYALEIVVPALASVVVTRDVGGALQLAEEADAADWAARAPSMNAVLIDALAGHAETALAWQAATSALASSTRQITLGTGAGFDLFFARHGGHSESALRELQAAFARVVAGNDAEAFGRLGELLAAHLRAGERRLREHPAYFAGTVASIAAMFKIAPRLAVPEDVALLVEDLEDSGNSGSASALRAAMSS